MSFSLQYNLILGYKGGMGRKKHAIPPGQLLMLYDDGGGNALQEEEPVVSTGGGGLRAASRELRAIEMIAAVTGLPHETAEAILKKAGGLHRLARLPEYALQTLPQVDKGNAKKIRALTEWALLLNEAEQEQVISIRSPTDIANLLMLEMGILEQEELRVVGLDTKNHLVGINTVYRGSVNSAVVRISEVLRMPVAHQCSSMILVHNHPSGDPQPSPEDVHVTGMIADAARQMDIDLLDHLVIGNNRFVSLKERGMGFA